MAVVVVAPLPETSAHADHVVVSSARWRVWYLVIDESEGLVQLSAMDVSDVPAGVAVRPVGADGVLV